MPVSVVCAVSPNALPAVITVRNGRKILYQKTVFRPLTVFCVCAREKTLFLTVHPIYADYGEETRFIRLVGERRTCRPCIRAAFTFPAVKEAATWQRFTLTDATYRFPVAEATLTLFSA